MKHTHTWRELKLKNIRGEGGFVACACGDAELLTARALTEFRWQREYAKIEPVIDDEGIQLIARKRSASTRAPARSSTPKRKGSAGK